MRSCSRNPDHRSELSRARLLAQLLAEREAYDPDAALRAYQFWPDSDSFGCGMTISASLRGYPNPMVKSIGRASMPRST